MCENAKKREITRERVKTPYFFWKKLAALSVGFSYPGNSKKYFLSSWGSQLGPGALLARFRAEKGYFRAIFYENQSFLAFEAFFLTGRTSKHCKYPKKYL